MVEILAGVEVNGDTEQVMGTVPVKEEFIKIPEVSTSGDIGQSHTHVHIVRFIPDWKS